VPATRNNEMKLSHAVVWIGLQGMDYELPESAMQQLRDVAGDVSMRFRYGSHNLHCCSNTSNLVT
jgi:hypothetical protein